MLIGSYLSKPQTIVRKLPCFFFFFFFLAVVAVRNIKNLLIA